MAGMSVRKVKKTRALVEGAKNGTLKKGQAKKMAKSEL